MYRLCIITGAHLCRNPRVVKEAEALVAAGYSVTILGPVFTGELAVQDAAIIREASLQHAQTVDLRGGSISGSIARVRRRLGAEAVRWIGLQSPHSLGYGLHGTLRLARQLDADLYIGHQELGLWVVERLAREGWRVGVDLEDWYSEDLLPEARKRRPTGLLRRLEAAALRRRGHITTTSHVLARALGAAYLAKAPEVVYNAFPWQERKTLDRRRLDREERSKPSLHWVSQTIGAGRGLEMLFEALEQVKIAIDLHLRGACAAQEAVRLHRLFPAARGHRLFMHDMVPPAQLLSRIAEHDIGLALEEREPASRNLTITNKILHYLLAGLAVIATDTEGQREVAEAAPEAVRLCRAGDAASLAGAINQLLRAPDQLEAAKSAALEAARTRFCWERQVPVLLESVEQALNGNNATAGVA